MTDSDLDNDTVAAASEESRADWPSPGKKLRLIREDLGLSHARVADALHMTAHYVKALENDQFEKLPGRTFIKGYFKAYAKFLGADVDDVMQCYEQYVAALEESETTEANVIRARKAYDQNIRWLICAAIIVVIVVGVSWWLSGDDVSAAAVPVEQAENIAAVADDSTADMRNAAAQVANAGALSSQTVEPLRADLRVMTETVTTMSASEPASESASEVEIVAGEREIPVTSHEEIVDLAAPVIAEQIDSTQVIESPVDETLDNTVVHSESPEEVTDAGNGLPENTVTRVADHRLVELELAGNDLVIVHSEGESWVEVDDGDSTRLFHDMLRPGDDLNIRGTAPFSILLGDANEVDITFNSRPVSIPRIRQDNSARVLLETETR